MYKTVEVDVEFLLEDVETEDLLEELEDRGLHALAGESLDLLTKIYQKRIMGQDYQQELDELIWQTLGRM